MTPPADAPVVAALGSPESAGQVVRLAAREAAGHRRPLRLLHAFNWSAALEAPSVTGPRARAEELLEQAAAAAGEAEPAVPVSGEIVEGAPVAALVRRSESAFLVVIGDGGMSRCGACIPADAPAVQLAARAGCPVLVVRPEPPPQGPVLVGVDGSASSRTALAFAFGCAARRSARLLAVRVVEPPPEDRNVLGTARAELAEVVARCGRRHPEVSTECHVVVGDPGAVMVEQSRSAQLTVVAARGDEPLRGMLGAVSQSLLYHSPAPVIVVRGLVSTAPGGA
ncbi:MULTISPECIES: universal stress protein [Micromonospora]|uniref:Universal stress protein UspA n=1 Tax=Micromonospora haikouensis TaxID=686309 RepID=A0A0D0VYP9_9ACTN|nr:MULTISPECIES: universal stress protein [Micromonospora]KIR65788.1 universal stress protein UspA [Micromonospora haikouensis]